MYLLFMNKFAIITIFLLISNCTLNKVVKHHGVHYLDKKQEKLILSNTNKNDIIKILGPPSTKSTFDNDVWVYIERKHIESSLFKLGKNKLIVNNVLIIEINNQGLLVKKDFLDINQVNEYKFSEETTEVTYKKNTFLNDFLSSLRQKIDAPAKKRRK
tara:strand:- start:208 stop:681 length:474 start_codon:yes stop_codon:yes gene_type:complete